MQNKLPNYKIRVETNIIFYIPAGKIGSYVAFLIFFYNSFIYLFFFDIFGNLKITSWLFKRSAPTFKLTKFLPETFQKKKLQR